jgi:hypothetical protein
MAILLHAAGSVTAQNEVTLPAPTGPHQTGRMSFHWKEASRDELETSAPSDKRELMAHLFYPGDAKAAGNRAAYVPDADAMRPPYNARAVRFPDGRVLGNLPPAERGWRQSRNREENQRFYQERIMHWSRDVSFVIDQLTALDRGKGPFAKRLDLERGVGVFGHSRGGQAAGTVRLLDSRVRGGINIDGTAGENAIISAKDGPAKEGDAGVGAQPFLWIQGSLPAPPTDEQLQRAGRTRAFYDAEIERVMASWRRQLSAITGGALRVYIDRPGIQHIDFSDEPFWDGTMTPANRSGRVQTIADTRKWVRAFFDGTVRGDWVNLKRLATQTGTAQPEITVHVFGKLWP